MNDGFHRPPLTDAALCSVVALVVAHGAVNNAIAVAISVLASLLGASRDDVRAEFGSRVRQAFQATRRGVPIAATDEQGADLDRLAVVAALGGGGTAEAIAERMLDALRLLPDASQDPPGYGLPAIADAARRALTAPSPQS